MWQFGIRFGSNREQAKGREREKESEQMQEWEDEEGKEQEEKQEQDKENGNVESLLVFDMRSDEEKFINTLECEKWWKTVSGT